MGVGSASVVDYANTYPGTASHVNATGSVGDFEVVVDGSGATTLSLNFQTTATLDPRITFSRTSNATLVGSDGLIQYAPHNLLTYSEQFDNAAWTKTDATVSTNTITAPDGTTTADTVVYSGASVTPSQTIASATTTYTISTYVKSSNTSFCRLRVSAVGGGSTAFSSYFNIATSVVSSTGVATADFGSLLPSITSVGNGWYRISVTFTVLSALTSITYGIVAAQTSGGASSAGDELYIWGAQLNQGALQPYYSTTVKNLLGYSQNFENAAWTKSNSSIAASTIIGPFGFDGGQKLVESTNNVLHYVAQTQSTSTNSVLTLSIYAKAGERTQVDVRVGGVGWATSPVCIVNLITGAIVSGSGATVVPVGDGWFRISLTAIADGTTQSRGIVVAPAVAGNSTYTGDGTSGIYIFGAQLSDSASLDPYSYNPVAAPTSTAYYGPRFDYDPVTLAPKGLLIEEQRTNLLTYSSELENTAWTKTDATVSTNTITAPDGTSAADTLIATTINADHVIDESFSAIAGTTYTMSGYVKAAGLTSIGLRFTNASLWPLGGSPQVSFNLVTKTMTVISGQPSAYTITEVNNGWFRIAVSATCAVSGIAGARFQLVSGLSNVFLGDGSSGSYIWGAQLEAGAFPTSYIPTTSATVTRAADNASMEGSNFSSWYNQSEGTIYAAVSFTNTSSFNTVYSITDGTTSNVIRTIQWNNGTDRPLIITTLGATQISASSTGQIGSAKYAAAFKLNNANYAKNGVLGVDDPSVTLPTVNQLSFGSTAGSTFYLNGHIQSIKYYPTRLPNGTLQGLTA